MGEIQNNAGRCKADTILSLSSQSEPSTGLVFSNFDYNIMQLCAFECFAENAHKKLITLIKYIVS